MHTYCMYTVDRCIIYSVQLLQCVSVYCVLHEHSEVQIRNVLSVNI